jgi:hypothetical protein
MTIYYKVVRVDGSGRRCSVMVGRRFDPPSEENYMVVYKENEYVTVPNKELQGPMAVFTLPLAAANFAKFYSSFYAREVWECEIVPDEQSPGVWFGHISIHKADMPYSTALASSVKLTKRLSRFDAGSKEPIEVARPTA